MPESWSLLELEVIISDYLDMLNKELRGIPVSKTQHRNTIKRHLNNRSDGSIEFKHQNISAVLIKLGLPFINGYKPRWNYQGILEDELIAFIRRNRKSLEQSFIKFTEAYPTSVMLTDFSKITEAAPENTFVAEPDVKYDRKPIKINYLEREQLNTNLGAKGEELIIQFEKWRLTRVGKENWIDKVQWISKIDDGAGFDILSKNPDGSDRYIEVKTTKLNKQTPIFFSKNELDFSIEKKENFYLYRLFNFADNPKMFCLQGDFDSFCRKTATHFKGYF